MDDAYFNMKKLENQVNSKLIPNFKSLTSSYFTDDDYLDQGDVDNKIMILNSQNY